MFDLLKRILFYIAHLMRSCIVRLPLVGSTINRWMGYTRLRQSLDDDDDDDDGDHGGSTGDGILLRNRSIRRTDHGFTSDVDRFVTEFEERHGSIHPRFFVGDNTPNDGSVDDDSQADSDGASFDSDSVFKQFIAKAKAEYRPMLVYLHSEEHENTPRFCRRVLCTQSFRDYVDENFLFFGADILSPAGMMLGYRLEASTFPYMAVMIAAGSKVEVVARIEGYVDLDTLISRLIEIHDRVEPTLIVQRTEEEQRQAERRMREEQDRAYAAAVERDRQAMERRRREEEEARLAAQEAEQLKRRFTERLERIAEERRDIRAQLPEEASREDKNSSLIRFRFPNGTQLERRFLKSDPTELLYRFVHSLDESHGSPWSPRPFSTLDKYTLSTNFPKRDLDMSGTLESAQCHPHAVLFVHEDVDEEDELLLSQQQQQSQETKGNP